MEDRRHAAIMFTGIVGYTALIGSDEDSALEILQKNKKIHYQIIEEFDGTFVKEMGDGILISFPLSSKAVRCAIEIQKACREQKIPLRVGIHEGETVFAGSDVFGDGVNISSRLLTDAREGSINISEPVYRNIRNKADIKTRFAGEKTLKNVEDPIKVYNIILEDKESDVQVEKDAREKKPTSKYPKYVLYATIVVILAILLFWFIFSFGENEQLEKSIAVRPFWNESADQENEFFVNGMTEDIRSNLAKISNFHVISRGSVEKYRDTEHSTIEIADELNVNYVLEGTVQKLGGHIKIHAQLILAKNDDHIWEDTFEKEISDIKDVYTIQSQIAQSIANELKVIITPDEKQIIETIPTNNPEAYELYLRARDFHSRGDSSSVNIAIHFYNQAIVLDPKFALAYVWLGVACFHQTWRIDYYSENYADTIKYYADKALSINPDLSDGHWLRAEYYFQRTEHENSINEAGKAIQLNPNNALAIRILGMNYYLLREYANAFIHLKKARKILIGDLDQYPKILIDLATLYSVIGDYEKADRELQELMEYDPVNGSSELWLLNFLKGEIDKSKIYIDSICEIDSGFNCRFALMYHYIYTGEFERFKAKEDKLDLFSMANPIWKGYILFNLNRKEEARKNFKQAFEELERAIELERLTGTGGLDLYDMAAQYSFLGEKETAYQILHDMEEKRVLEGWAVWWMHFDPRFEDLRQEAEFQAIIQRQEKRYDVIRAELDSLEEAGML